MDKTYAETQGQAPFDWNKELDELIAGKFITDQEHYAMRIRANSWVTCAVGNRCAIIPREYHGSPVDKVLWRMGDEFATEFANRRYESAKSLLTKIEARSAILIRQELAKLNTARPDCRDGEGRE